MQQLSGLKRAGRGDKFALQLAPGSMQFFFSTSLSVLVEKACACGGGIGVAETTKLSANNVTSREIRCIRNQRGRRRKPRKGNWKEEV